MTLLDRIRATDDLIELSMLVYRAETAEEQAAICKRESELLAIEREASRDEVRTGSSSPTVKRVMERFWRRVDQVDGNHPSPERKQ